ncbi:MAG: response regulator transcription factor [Pseudomonadales bacterium]|nr:MAG: response regulator transcription factor [Pseudomonadales bacterium]
MNNEMIRLLVADDHPVVCAGIRQTLFASHGVSIVDSVQGPARLLERLEGHDQDFDVLLSGYILPAAGHSGGLSLFQLIRRKYPNLNIVVLTMQENPSILHALASSGISCILSKRDPLSHLLPAIQVAMAKGRYLSPRIATLMNNSSRRAGFGVLSPRELEVVRLFVSGLKVNEIAERLHRSKKTISTQKTTAMQKLGLERDAELIRYSIEMGLLEHCMPVQLEECVKA